MTVSLSDIQRAKKRIDKYVFKTLLRRSSEIEELCGFKAPVFLKTENLQKTGSFKVRGATNKMLRLLEQGKKPSHVVAASAGNHAQAVAYMARELGIPATIVMPEGAPLVKVQSTRNFGARVVLHGLVYDEAYKKAQEILKETPGAHYIHAYADEDVIAGQGTIGLEIFEQLEREGLPIEPLQVVVPVGGGGLISGISIALRSLAPDLSIHGVVSQSAPAMAESFAAGKVVKNEGQVKTIAEGLAVKSVSEVTFPIVQKNVSQMVSVSDLEVASAIVLLMERSKLIVEGAGAAGVAAVLSGILKLDPHIPTVFVLCGGNIDLNLVSLIIERGLLKTDRWLDLELTVDDQPGQLALVTRLIGESGANVLQVSHERGGEGCRIGQTEIAFRLETRGKEHALEIKRKLEDNGIQLRVRNNE